MSRLRFATLANLLWICACQGGSAPAAAPAPLIESFVAMPASIMEGASSTLHWEVVGAVSVSITGIAAVTGSSVSVSPAATTTYTLTATNSSGSVTATATVTVTVPASAPVINSFTATPATIVAGGASTLAWAVTGATSLSISGIGTVTWMSTSVSPSSTTTYTLTATNSSGSVTATATITVTAPVAAPVINSFTATPATIVAGSASTLAWDVTGATSLSISGIGTVTGMSTSVSPSSTTTYTLTATNSSGSVTATATVTVTPLVAAPVINSFTATPATIVAGGASTLAWDVTGATSLSVSGIGTVTGMSTSVSPSSTTTYTLTATNSSGSVTATATVTVTPLVAAPVINSFTATPTTIIAGGTSTLAWDVTGATSLSISGIGTVTGASLTVTPATTTTYVLTATNSGGSITASATVTVRAMTSPCGNGQIDPGEACDPTATPPVPAATTCASLGQGFTGGTLSCSTTCQLVTSQCTLPTLLCMMGMTQPYYNGPAGTEGVGTCTAGVETCAPDGMSWTVTTPDVEPQSESCGNPLDVSCDGQIATACTPSTQHPRLWITPADIPRLQAWATSSNPMYQALTEQLATAQAVYSTGNQWNAAPYNGPFYLNGAPNPNWPDDGTSGVGAPYAEAYAEIFAFMALVDTANSAMYAQQARNLLMYVMNTVVNCPPPVSPYGPWTPYCDPLMATFNRGNYVGEAWGLTVDWLQAADPTGQIFTAADRATTRQVFLLWATDVMNNVYYGVNLAYPLLNYMQGDNQVQLRIAANNYYSGNTRTLTLMALSLDAADDPPLDGNPANVNVRGNTLRSWIPSYVLPVRLYQQYAMYEDAATVSAAYNLSSLPAAERATMDRVGLANGGLPVEGFLYGHSLGYVMQELYALHTSGNDGIVQGSSTYPQANLINSTYWDTLIAGLLESITLAPKQPKAPYAYLPPVYQMSSYGDLLYEYITDFDFVPTLSVMALNFASQNKTTQQEQALWMASNTMPGGPSNLKSQLADDWNSVGTATGTILAFDALDPSVPLNGYADPRPSMPTTFVAAPISRVVSRTDWTADATVFDHLCEWASINHENGTCGQFELYRKGEWLTKERSGYDNGVYPAPAWGYAPDYHNIVGIQNNLANVDESNMGPSLLAVADRGGQWNNNLNAGDPTTVASHGDNYVYAQDIATNLYNYVPNKFSTSGRALDVLHASRSILWLKPDHVVVYDRAESMSPDMFKRFNLVLVQATDTMSNPIPPIIAGSLVTGTTPGGQNLYVQALLPATATTSITTNLVEELNPVALLEPTEEGPVVNSSSTPSGYHVSIQDTTNPTTIRFLTMVEGADADQAVDVAQTVTTTGQPFDGAAITRTRNGVNENLLALFMHDIIPAPPASWTATCPLPISIPTGNTFVADLLPSTTYYVTTGASQVTVSTDASSGGVAQVTDSAGLLEF